MAKHFNPRARKWTRRDFELLGAVLTGAQGNPPPDSAMTSDHTTPLPGTTHLALLRAARRNRYREARRRAEAT